jgi:tetratricopeptide (TPR) repeat protein
LSAGNHPVCLHAFEHALTLKPSDPNTRYNFALALQSAGYPLDAAAELNRVLAARPNDTRTHLALGNLHARQLGDAGKAREHYEAVVRLDPEHPEAASIRYWLASHP